MNALICGIIFKKVSKPSHIIFWEHRGLSRVGILCGWGLILILTLILILILKKNFDSHSEQVGAPTLPSAVI
jgi:hypothetical protein